MPIYIGVPSGKTFFEKHRERLKNEAVLVAESSFFRICLTNERDRLYFFVESKTTPPRVITVRTADPVSRTVEDTMRDLFQRYVLMKGGET